ncbi:hypothetical protein BH23CHL6_BH23CHL6_04050 [soil metagenome]
MAAPLGVLTLLINDARAFGLGELLPGAARGATSMVGLTEVTVELGVWAGAVGAAIHGAERDAA